MWALVLVTVLMLPSGEQKMKFAALKTYPDKATCDRVAEPANVEIGVTKEAANTVVCIKILKGEKK